MNGFQYFTPTKILFGQNTEEKVAEQVKSFGGTKVLVVYGSGSVVRSGLLERVKKSLDEAGIPHVERGGVVPNPHLEWVYDGIEFARAEGVDFVLGVGGGSAIDSAKGVALGLANDGDVWDFYCGKRKPTAMLPVGTVLTMAATGTEMSNSTVLTKADGLYKRGIANDICRPCFSIMNPDLTITLPAYQTASGCTDIMMHTIERYFHSSENGLELTDTIAEALLRTVMKNAIILADDPTNQQARAEVMWAGSLSHNGLTGCGFGAGDWICHKMEHELGGLYDVTHGAGLAALWGSWARYVMPYRPARFARYAVEVMGVEPGANDEETALRGIEAMENFFRRIKMPTTMAELGISPTEEEIDDMAGKCAGAIGGGGGSIRRLEKADMIEIYHMAMK